MSVTKKKTAKKGSPKTDALKGHKAKAVEKKKPEAKSNGEMTTDELADSISRDLIIHYVSVESENNFLVLTATDKNKKLPKEIEDTFQVPVHKKLITAIQKLRPHAALLTHHIDNNAYAKISDIPAELYADFNITSVHFKYGGKKGDNMQINATLKTPRGKAFNFTTPIEYLYQDDDKTYGFIDVVKDIRQLIFDRVDAYMSGEERGEINDVGIFAESDNKVPVPADHLDEHTENEVA